MNIGQILKPLNLFVFTRKSKLNFYPGDVIFLKLLNKYSIFSNLFSNNKNLPAYSKSAGTYCQLLEIYTDSDIGLVSLPTGATKLVQLDSYITLGRNSNLLHKYTVTGSAGLNRLKGRKPVVRGVAMNPVDHPMGGGEGKSSGGHPRSRNGIPAKGFRTRSKTKASNKYIIERRKK